MTAVGARPRRIRAVFVCQAVDLDDPVLPTTVRWIKSLAGKPIVDHVSVLALRTGRYELPASVDVARFGRSNRLATVGAFYSALARSLRHRPHCFFVYQGGHYPLLLLPFKLLRRIPIVQWKAHPVISRSMAFYARWCDDLILTSARAAFPMDLHKVRVVGQGVDTERFRPQEQPLRGDLVAVGRISPVKGVEQMVRAVAHANRAYGTGYRFNLYGPTLPADQGYAAGVVDLIAALEARDWVRLHGPAPQEALPAILNGHRAALNFSTGALDKSAVEAMACGLPVVSTNAAVREAIPPELHPLLAPGQDSAEAQAGTIHELLRRPDSEVGRLGQRLRELVIRDHSIERLFDRVLAEIEALLGDRD